jgi:hypothetical protein
VAGHAKISAVDPMFEEALAYAEAGLAVFPVNGKTPFKGSRGVYDASTDPARIREMWARRPGANIAIACGVASGIVVVDDDSDEARAELAALERQHGPLPETPKSRTRRGHHRYLSIPVGETVRHKGTREVSPLEVVSDGHYVVAPPSTHPEGIRYEWVNDIIEFAEAPRWLIRYANGEVETFTSTADRCDLDAQRLPPVAARVTAGLVKPRPDFSQGYEEGQRNNECARRAGSCLARGMTEEETLSECLGWNRGHNQPPLEDEEVRATVASIAKRHARNQGASASLPGVMPPFLRHGLKTIRADELLATRAPPRRWLVERFVPAAEVTLLGGDGAIGKTTLALQLGVACISGGDWLGLKVNACNVLYAGAEDPTDDIHFRLEEMTKQLPVSKDNLARFQLIDLAGDDATALATFHRNDSIKSTVRFREIEAIAKVNKVGLIVFDAAADFFGGDENDRREVRAFIGMLRSLAMRLDAAVIMIAHPSVEGMKTGRGYSGSTHWNNAVRSRLYFTEAERDEGAPPNPDLRVIELAKANRARRGEKIHVMWADGRFVAVSPGSVVNHALATEVDERFLHQLAKLNSRGMHLSPNRSSAYAPAIIARQPGSNGVGKHALEAAMNRLLDAGKIRVEEYGPPSKRRHRLVVSAEMPPPGVDPVNHRPGAAAP